MWYPIPSLSGSNHYNLSTVPVAGQLHASVGSSDGSVYTIPKFDQITHRVVSPQEAFGDPLAFLRAGPYVPQMHPVMPWIHPLLGCFPASVMVTHASNPVSTLHLRGLPRAPCGSLRTFRHWRTAIPRGPSRESCFPPTSQQTQHRVRSFGGFPRASQSRAAHVSRSRLT